MSETLRFDELAKQGGHGIPNDPAKYRSVYRAVRAEAGGDVAFLKSKDLGLSLSNMTVGRIINQLKDWDDCPLNIEIWGGKASPPRICRVAPGGRSE